MFDGINIFHVVGERKTEIIKKKRKRNVIFVKNQTIKPNRIYNNDEMNGRPTTIFMNQRK